MTESRHLVDIVNQADLAKNFGTDADVITDFRCLPVSPTSAAVNHRKGEPLGCSSNVAIISLVTHLISRSFPV